MPGCQGVYTPLLLLAEHHSKPLAVEEAEGAEVQDACLAVAQLLLRLGAAPNEDQDMTVRASSDAVLPGWGGRAGEEAKKRTTRAHAHGSRAWVTGVHSACCLLQFMHTTPMRKAADLDDRRMTELLEQHMCSSKVRPAAMLVCSMAAASVGCAAPTMRTG